MNKDDSLNIKPYVEILYRLILVARQTSYSLARDFKDQRLEKLIEITEVAHNLPYYILEGERDQLEGWLELFDLDDLLKYS